MIRTPYWWNERTLTSDALAPLSWIYRVLSAAQRARQEVTQLDIPVLCIGNLTAGGSGKTPVCLAIGRLLKERGINAFFVSRGYGGALAGPVQVEPLTHTAQQVGDEPLLLAEVLPTIVAHERAAGASYAQSLGAKLVILDDGFQNPSLHKNCSLLVVDGNYGFGNERLLPAGPLREPVAEGLARAQGVVVIGPPVAYSLRALTQPPLAATLSVTDGIRLQGKRVVGFAGIAHPRKFQATLTQAGAEVVQFISFGDHHSYTEQNIARLRRAAQQAQAQLVTTAKDWVRLPADFRAEVQQVPVALSFTDPQALEALLAPLIERARAA